MTQKKVHSKARSSSPAKTGQLIIVGGREDKQNDRLILKEIVRRTKGGKIVVATAASEMAEVLWLDYRDHFRDLGLKKIEHLSVAHPEEARDPYHMKILEGAQTIFFTGGDQLKITSKLGGTGIEDFIIEHYRNGGIIAGTSAGASVMGQIMLVGNENSESHKIGNWMMAPGLNLAKGMIIDQHFAQRGRLGRLLGAIALNPGLWGIGIDEDTAIIIENGHFQVLGSNAVYVVDGHSVTYTNVNESSPEKTMSMHDAKLHILADQEVFDFKTRRPLNPRRSTKLT